MPRIKLILNKKFHIKSLLLASLCVSSFAYAANDLPNIKIIATGGTIAGAGKSATQSSYKAGKVGVQDLISAVPNITNIANISGEQLVNIGSQDMNNKVWLKLSQRINELLSDDEVDGIVITHGTDTMEETAYFLDLTIKSDKPVVMVGAMRPSTALSADGPMNLYNAVATAASNNSYKRGVLVTMNGSIFDARDVIKTNTLSLQAFQSPNFGALGYINNSKVIYKYSLQDSEQKIFNISKIKNLPEVGIVYNYANASALPVNAFIQADYKGIISAGVGNGNIYKDIFVALEKAGEKGIKVVRSSRVATGPTTLDAEIDDEKYGFIASGSLNPQKARILLMLALTETSDYKQIQHFFNM